MLPASDPSLHLSSWVATIWRSASSSRVSRSNWSSWRDKEEQSVRETEREKVMGFLWEAEPCLCMLPHGSISIVQRIQAHGGHCVRATECVCMMDQERVCERISRERVRWFDWFSQSHLKLWMSWSLVYLKSPTSIPSPPKTLQSTMQFISPLFTHAYSNLLISLQSLSLSLPVSLSHTQSTEGNPWHIQYICSTSGGRSFILLIFEVLPQSAWNKFEFQSMLNI